MSTCSGNEKTITTSTKLTTVKKPAINKTSPINKRTKTKLCLHSTFSLGDFTLEIKNNESKSKCDLNIDHAFDFEWSFLQDVRF